MMLHIPTVHLIKFTDDSMLVVQNILVSKKDLKTETKNCSPLQTTNPIILFFWYVLSGCVMLPSVGQCKWVISWRLMLFRKQQHSGHNSVDTCGMKVNGVYIYHQGRTQSGYFTCLQQPHVLFLLCHTFAGHCH